MVTTGSRKKISNATKKDLRVKIFECWLDELFKQVTHKIFVEQPEHSEETKMEFKEENCISGTNIQYIKDRIIEEHGKMLEK